MSDVYAIRRNGLGFKELDLELQDLWRHMPDDLPLEDVDEFGIRNTQLKSWWWNPVTEFMNAEGHDDAEIPDIGLWIDATLVLSPKALRFLGELLKDYGEFLPVIVDDVEYQIFNCFVIGEVDEDKSKFEDMDGERGIVEYLEFKESAAESLVFKTPLESCMTLFCNQRFRDIVEDCELTGVSFDTKLVPVFEF